MAEEITFADYADWAGDQSVLYERLTRATAQDKDILTLAESVPANQPKPNLLLGAVHDLLLRGSDHRLADFYATCTADPLDPGETDPFPAFKAFCLAHADELRERFDTRLVQTNAVGRSAVLYLAFARVAQESDEIDKPLALIEIGSSAGLNCNWDRYRYDYDGRVVGALDSPVTIESTLRGDGEPLLPETPPDVSHRVGVDLNPLDPANPDDARWLRALVPPNQRVRHERLASALELASESPPNVRKGDAVDVLPDLLAETPEDATVCVFSTVTLYQFPDEAIRAIRDELLAFSTERPVHWVSGDPEADVTDPTLRHVAFREGEAVSSDRIARFDAYCSWIEWL